MCQLMFNKYTQFIHINSTISTVFSGLSKVFKDKVHFKFSFVPRNVTAVYLSLTTGHHESSHHRQQQQQQHICQHQPASFTPLESNTLNSESSRKQAHFTFWSAWILPSIRPSPRSQTSLWLSSVGRSSLPGLRGPYRPPPGPAAASGTAAPAPRRPGRRSEPWWLRKPWSGPPCGSDGTPLTCPRPAGCWRGTTASETAWRSLRLSPAKHRRFKVEHPPTVSVLIYMDIKVKKTNFTRGDELPPGDRWASLNDTKRKFHNRPQSERRFTATCWPGGETNF